MNLPWVCTCSIHVVLQCRICFDKMNTLCFRYCPCICARLDICICRDIHVGEVILEEEPLVCASSFEHRCIQCYEAHESVSCSAVQKAFPQQVVQVGISFERGCLHFHKGAQSCFLHCCPQRHSYCWSSWQPPFCAQPSLHL